MSLRTLLGMPKNLALRTFPCTTGVGPLVVLGKKSQIKRLAANRFASDSKREQDGEMLNDAAAGRMGVSPNGRVFFFGGVIWMLLKGNQKETPFWMILKGNQKEPLFWMVLKGNQKELFLLVASMGFQEETNFSWGVKPK